MCVCECVCDVIVAFGSIPITRESSLVIEGRIKSEKAQVTHPISALEDTHTHTNYLNLLHKCLLTYTHEHSITLRQTYIQKNK